MLSTRGLAMSLLGLCLLAGLDSLPAYADFTFSEPVNLKEVIPVIDAADESIDCLSYDGLEIYVCSFRSGGSGSCDLWRIRRDSVDEDWGPAENLGSAVNSAYNEALATISADGLTLYFNSTKSGGHGEGDIYMTTRATRNDPREALTGLNQELAALQHHLSELTAQTMALTGTIHELKFLGVDLTGDWQLTLPAGFTCPAVISRQADGLWRLEVRGVMRGAYRQDGHRFRIVVPSDERLTEFVWEGISPDHLLLIESPPVAKIGSDYRGATLMRTQP